MIFSLSVYSKAKFLAGLQLEAYKRSSRDAAHSVCKTDTSHPLLFNNTTTSLPLLFNNTTTSLPLPLLQRRALLYLHHHHSLSLSLYSNMYWYSHNELHYPKF